MRLLHPAIQAIEQRHLDVSGADDLVVLCSGERAGGNADAPLATVMRKRRACPARGYCDRDDFQNFMYRMTPPVRSSPPAPTEPGS